MATTNNPPHRPSWDRENTAVSIANSEISRIRSPQPTDPLHQEKNPYAASFQPLPIDSAAGDRNSFHGTYIDTQTGAYPLDPLVLGAEHWRFSRPASTQRWALIKDVALRMLGSALIMGMIVLVFNLFARIEVLTDRHKYLFNTFSVFLFLIYGIHLLLAYKDYADMARWRILAKEKHNLKELSLVLGLGSFRSTLKLGLLNLVYGKPGRKWLYEFMQTCGWVALLTLVNIGIAIIGLTYSVDASEKLGFRPGEVSIVNLERYYPNNSTSLDNIMDFDTEFSTEFFMANLYGTTSWSYHVGSYEGDPPPDDEYWLQQYSNGSWRYTFHDMNYYGGGLIYTTDRFVTTNQSCKSYRIESIYHGIINGSFGQHVAYFDRKLINITMEFLIANASTYVYDPETPCDRPRCMRVQAFQLNRRMVEGKLEEGYYYDCFVEMSQVYNAKNENHELADLQARMAAAGITFPGYLYDGARLNGGDRAYRHYRNDVEAGIYHDGNITAMESTLSQFAVGVIAATDSLNPREFVYSDKQPFRGHELEVKWWAFYSLVFGLLGIQLICGIIAIMFSNTVVVQSGSIENISRLLRVPLEENDEKLEAPEYREEAEWIYGAKATGTDKGTNIRLWQFHKVERRPPPPQAPMSESASAGFRNPAFM